ncbi:MAG: hypothetical protein FD180_3885 [Planctomycetota bacterium]|nr:MAG: hypothetical protein FD180_3885 [Planctomycetota bacterium]
MTEIRESLNEPVFAALGFAVIAEGPAEGFETPDGGAVVEVEMEKRLF